MEKMPCLVGRSAVFTKACGKYLVSFLGNLFKAFLPLQTVILSEHITADLFTCIARCVQSACDDVIVCSLLVMMSLCAACL